MHRIENALLEYTGKFKLMARSSYAVARNSRLAPTRRFLQRAFKPDLWPFADNLLKHSEPFAIRLNNS